MGREKINDFLSGKLSDNDYNSFKEELLNNQNLLDEVANESVKEYGRIKLKNKLNKFDIEINRPKHSIKKYLLAAVIAFAVGIPLLMNVLTEEVSEQKLFAQYFSPYKSVTSVRGTETNDELLSKGMIAYSNNDYELAIINLEKIKEKSYVTNFYLGVCYLSVIPPKGNKSIIELNKVFNTDNDFHQQATWYKALALLVSNKNADAKILLQEIVNNKWFNFVKAKKILQSI